MNFKKRIWVALLIASLGFGGAAFAKKKRKNSKTVLPMTVVEAVVCEKIEEIGGMLRPVAVAEKFPTDIQRLHGYIRFQHILRAHKLRWRWYDPDGKLYTESSDLVVKPTGKYHKTFTASHPVVVRGERAMLKPGRWKLVIYLDDAVVATKGFELFSGPTES